MSEEKDELNVSKEWHAMMIYAEHYGEDVPIGASQFLEEHGWYYIERIGEWVSPYNQEPTE